MDISGLIKTEKKGGITILTMNRPDGMNILDTGMLQALGQCLLDLEKDEQTRTVIITGEKHFSAGADIREMKDKNPEEARVFSALGQQVCSLIEDMGKVVIAAVRGLALGGGCEIAIACDMRIASGNARFGQPELILGLVPAFGATQRLPRLVGVGKAKELILTGKIIDAKEAGDIGLVNRVVKDEELMKHAEDEALLVAQRSPLVVAISKKLMSYNHGMTAGLERETKCFSGCFATEDHSEGITSFLEKRTPRFKGR